MPATPEEEWTYWDDKATELRRNQLTTVQSAATKWSALLTALLGVFGTVAFAGGLTTLDKLPDPWPGVTRAMTTVAATCAILAIWFLTQAAGGLSLARRQGLSATSVRTLYTTGTDTAMSRLTLGKKAAAAAAAFVVAGSLIVLWVGEASTTAEPPSVLVVTSKRTLCGELGTAANGTLRVGKIALTSDVKKIVTVTKCPKVVTPPRSVPKK